MKIKILAFLFLIIHQSVSGQKKLIDLEKSNDYKTYTYPVSEENPEDVIILAIKEKEWDNLKKINAYKNVQELRIEKSTVKELIIDFNQFPLLQSVYTMECKFDTMIFKGNPVNFKALYVYEKHLSNYNFLPQLTELKEIYLDDVVIDIENLTANLLRLKNLSSIDLYGGGFQRLPASFAKLKSLEWLSLHNLDSAFDYDYNFNLIKDMEIKNLNLMYNFKNSVLSGSIGLLKKIKCLYLGNTSFTTLPEEIGELTQLTELNMSMCELSSVPSSIIKLVNLKKLMLMPCKFTTIPDVLYEMVWLEELEVGGEEWWPNKEELKPLRKKLKKTKVNDLPE